MMTNTKGAISNFIEKYYLHFNAASVVDAAKGYEAQLNQGSKMLVSLAGAMSTAELGKIFAEMIRKDKVQIISCTGANLEEDIMNLVAHSHYKRVPNYRDLTPQEEWDLLEQGLNRVTDTCIPEHEAFRRLQQHIFKIWKDADDNGERYLPHEYMYKSYCIKLMHICIKLVLICIKLMHICINIMHLCIKLMHMCMTFCKHA